MADQSKTAENWKVQPTNGWDPNFIAGLNQQIFGTWTRAISAVAAEMNQFLQARFQEDCGAWTRLTACKDMAEAFECQSRFWQKAAADYLDEANKLTRLAMSTALENSSPFRAEPREKVKAAA